MADKKAKLPKITPRVTCYTEQLSRDLNSGKLFLFSLSACVVPTRQTDCVSNKSLGNTNLGILCCQTCYVSESHSETQEKLCCCLLVEQIYIKNEKKFVDFALLFISKLIWEWKVFSLFNAIFSATVKQNHRCWNRVDGNSVVCASVLNQKLSFAKSRAFNLGYL